MKARQLKTIALMLVILEFSTTVAAQKQVIRRPAITTTKTKPQKREVKPSKPKPSKTNKPSATPTPISGATETITVKGV